MEKLATAAWLLAASAGATTLAAQTPIVAEGDVLPGLGIVTNVGALVPNSYGSGLALLHGAGGAALVRDGAIVVQKGDALVGSPWPFLSAWSYELDDAGRALWYGPQETSGLFDAVVVGVDARVLRAPGDAIGSPAFPAGTTYLGIKDLAANRVGDLLVHASLHHPGDPPGSGSPALVLMKIALDGSLVSETAIAQVGEILPGQTDKITWISPGDGIDVNVHGDVIFCPSQADGQKVFLAGVELVGTGDPAPIPGETWTSFFSARVNDAGDHAYLGTLSGGGQALVRNGALVAATGDVLHGAGGLSVDEIGLDRFELAEDGQVLWSGFLGGTGTAFGVRSLFVDDRRVLSEGDLLGGAPIEGIHAAQSRFHPLGGSIAVDLQFDAGEALWHLELASAEPLVGCGTNLATLEVAGPPPAIGADVELVLDAAQAPLALGFVAISLDAAPGWPPCGVAVPGGELLIDFAAPNPLAVLAAGAWGGAPVSASVTVAPPLFGAELFAQGLFVDLTGPEPLRLSGALRLGIGM